MKKRFKDMVLLGFKQFQDPYYQGVAAQVAFFFMLSIVPTMVIISQLLGIFNLSLGILTEYVDIGITPELISGLKGIFRLESQTSTNIVLLLAALWASSRLQFTLMRVTNYTISEGKDVGTYVKDRARSVATVFFTVISIVITIFVLVYGQLVFNFFAEKLNINTFLGAFYKYMRWPIAFILFLLVLSFNYYVLPHQRGSFKDVLPGGCFCAVGMLAVTMLYSVYTTYAVNNNIIYGSMASFAVLMFWFYFISWVLILGIFVNKVWNDTKTDNHYQKSRQ